MTYIINPKWIYWISVLDYARRFFLFTCVLIVLGLVIIGVIYLSCYEETEEEEELNNIKKPIKPLAVALLIVTMILIFVPSKATCYQMMIAQYATKENLQSAATDTKDFIVDIAEEIQESAEEISREKK